MVFEEKNSFYLKHFLKAPNMSSSFFFFFLVLLTNSSFFTKEISWLKIIYFYFFPVPAYSVLFPLPLQICSRLRNQITSLSRKLVGGQVVSAFGFEDIFLYIKQVNSGAQIFVTYICSLVCIYFILYFHLTQCFSGLPNKVRKLLEYIVCS